MRILLVGNLPEDRQQSMVRFASMLESGLASRGHAVTITAPSLRLARFAGPYRYQGVTKYLGYLDKYWLFPKTLRRKIASWKPDVVHIVDHSNAVYAPAAESKPVVLTCHDLLQVRAARGEFPRQPVGRLGRRQQEWILSHISRLRRIACVSEATRSDVLRLANVPASSTVVVPNALNYPYQPLPREVALAKVGKLANARAGAAAHLDFAQTDFILHVGGAHWYKNRSGLISIYAHLRPLLPSPVPLVLVGPPLSSEEEQQISALGIGADVFRFDSINNDELSALYSLASALLFPSWIEGFGWPIAEAQACGCPVFSSNRQPMTDIGGESAAYFDPSDQKIAASKIAQAWARRPSMRAAGLVNAQRWAPARMLEAYESVYSSLPA